MRKQSKRSSLRVWVGVSLLLLMLSHPTASFGQADETVTLAGPGLHGYAHAVGLPHTHGEGDDHRQADRIILTKEEEARLIARVEKEGLGVRNASAPAPQVNEHLTGKWEGPYDWPVVAIHAVVMANGKVLAYDSVGDNPAESYTVHNFTRATVWDPALNSHTPVTATTGYNLFCSGAANLPDGRVYLAGGNLNSALNGIDKTHIFNPQNNVWSIEGTMAQGGRWYPSVTPLANGEMMITGGGPATAEVRQANATLRSLSGVSYGGYYPWLQAAPNGQVFYAGPQTTMRYYNTAGSGTTTNVGARDSVNRDYGSYVMYDVGKILVAGGGYFDATARVIDLNNNAQATATASMANQRRQHNLTVLADGKVLATGGFANSNQGLVDLNTSVYVAEMWNPATGQWTTLAAMQRARMYHSTAMLLPDGRVLSAGGGICGTCQTVGYLQKNAEIFSPPYLFNSNGSGQLAPRPTISSAPAQVAYGQTFTVGSPQAAAISKVAFVRLGSVTHSVNMDQRYVPLTYSVNGGNLQITAPANANIAPPGHYMLFIIDNAGVPSVAAIVRVNVGSTSTTLLNADFNSGTNGFSYVDDLFRGTNQPNYASGNRAATNGYNDTGGLRVRLGGIDNSTVQNMSGGWNINFSMSTTGPVNLTFRYELNQSANYENDEYSQVLVAIDGVLKSATANDYVAQLTGNGGGGSGLSTGWQQTTINLGTLAAGNHSLRIGGFNNKKDRNNETTTIFIDDVVMTTVSGP